MMRLDNRVAVVTGGATGLGKVYALRLASEGADLAVWDIDLEGAEKTARLIGEKGRKAIGVKAVSLQRKRRLRLPNHFRDLR